MGTVPFGDIELHNHDPGYSVHIVHSMGKYCGTSQVVLLPQWGDSKERIVDPHKHCNSSVEILPSNSKSSNQCNEISIYHLSYIYAYELFTNHRIHSILRISSVPESWPKRF
jgi:hypothetical protein